MTGSASADGSGTGRVPSWCAAGQPAVLSRIAGRAASTVLNIDPAARHSVPGVAGDGGRGSRSLLAPPIRVASLWRLSGAGAPCRALHRLFRSLEDRKTGPRPAMVYRIGVGGIRGERGSRWPVIDTITGSGLRGVGAPAAVQAERPCWRTGMPIGNSICVRPLCGRPGTKAVDDRTNLLRPSAPVSEPPRVHAGVPLSPDRRLRRRLRRVRTPPCSPSSTFRKEMRFLPSAFRALRHRRLPFRRGRHSDGRRP